MIDPGSGRIAVKKGAALEPGMALKAFMALFPKRASGGNLRARDAAGNRWIVAPAFRTGRLQSLNLMVDHKRYGSSWDDWSLAKEKKRKAFHDAWLEDLGLGPEHDAPWGTIRSVYDERAGAAMILVTFKKGRAKATKRPSTISGPAKSKKRCATDAGMWALWDCDHFSDVKDYDDWEATLLEDADIEHQVRSGHLVPIDAGTDGVADITIEVVPAEQVADPPRTVERTAGPYKLELESACAFGGIEYVGAAPVAEAGSLPVAAGTYAVTLHQLKATKASAHRFLAVLEPADKRRFKAETSLGNFR